MTLRGGADSKQYRHNQQLEELRNLQDKLSGEKAAWAATREQEAKDLEEKRAEIHRLEVNKSKLYCVHFTTIPIILLGTTEGGTKRHHPTT